MKGLLIKEYYLLEGQIRSWLLVMGFMFLYAFFMSSNSFLYMLIVLIGVTSTLTVFNLDKTCGWDGFVTSLPVTRKEIVTARYLFAFLLDVSLSALCLILVCLHYIMRVEGTLSESLHYLLLILLLTLLMQTILLPAVYKWGVEKVQFVYMAFFLLLSAITFFIVQTSGSGKLFMAETELSFKQIMYIMEVSAMLFILLGGFLSLMVSVKIYEKKEF